jgi:hypothetical protein
MGTNAQSFTKTERTFRTVTAVPQRSNLLQYAHQFGRWFPNFGIFKLCGARDFIGLQALGADLQAADGAAHHGLDGLKVRLKDPLGAGSARGPLARVNVPDVLAAHRAFTADSTDIHSGFAPDLLQSVCTDAFCIQDFDRAAAVGAFRGPPHPVLQFFNGASEKDVGTWKSPVLPG